ncbi:MAG: sodium:solute symporter family protein [Vulcanimicrobiaceae bacterium]
MSAPLQALGIVGMVIAGTIGFALVSQRRFAADPQSYIVGGRRFGAIFLWVLLAGEVYTSFTFLGAAGWAYGYGAPAYYILAYGACGYVLGYFFLPAVWRIGKERGLLTAPDFFADRYANRQLGVAVGVLQVILTVPYITLQLTGLQILLSIAGYGQIDATLAVGIAFVTVALFVYLTGLRGTAWASVIKDALVLGAVLFAGIAIPIRFFGSPAAMLTALLTAHPGRLTLAGGTHPLGDVWYVSTVLLTSIGFYMGPHSIAAAYSARDGETLRRNAIFLPLYQPVLLLVFFAGFSALLIVPGLHGTQVDQSFLLVVARYYPAWLLGGIAAAGALAALVPVSALLLACGSIVSKNVLGDGLGLAQTDRTRLAATRFSVLAVALLALGLWLVARTTLVELLLLYYNGVTQFMPGFVAAFWWRSVNAPAVITGIIAGEITAAVLAYTAIPFQGINPGLMALLVNVALLCAITLLLPRKEPAAEATGSLP